MNHLGILIGTISFIAIGIFHPIVIRAVYHYGQSVWPVFLGAGILLIAASLFIETIILSTAAAVFGFASLWSIHEIKQQEEQARR